MSSIQDLQNKKIAILGLGIENYALVKFLIKHKIRCEITIFDKRKNVKVETGRDLSLQRANNINWRLGKNHKLDLNKFDILFRSPGWPITPLAPLIRGVNSPIRLFFDLCPTKNIIGVTGTKGKGTTASLIYEILKKRFERATTNGAHANVKRRRVWLGGNIGIAPFEFIDRIKKDDWVVLELSSFQLEDMKISPHIAVITNLTSEHLAPADPNNPNYHKTLKEYRDAKMNIIKWQGKEDKAVLNNELRIMNHELKSKICTFSVRNQKADCYWLDDNKIKFHYSLFIIHTSLLGEHNKENIAAAVCVAKIVGVKPATIKKAVVNFKGLEHRLELVKIVKGVKYYNDSFATTPESTIIALKSFSQPIILLAGGAEKKSDFKILAKEIKKRVKYVVLLDGQATPRLKKDLVKAHYPKGKMKFALSIASAVNQARQQATAGEIVLLSPACASFGMFKNYKKRGVIFKKRIAKLK